MRHVSLAELTKTLHGHKRVAIAVTIYSLWMDESSDKRRKEIVTVAGFIGNSDNTLHTETKWNQVLEEEGLEYFRASDCAGVDGAFRKFRRDPSPEKKPCDEDYQKAFGIRNRLLECIDSGNVFGVATSVIVPDFEQVWRENPAASRYFDKDPVFAAFNLLLIETTRQVSEQKPLDFVAFVYDENNAMTEKANSHYLALKKRNPAFAKWMGSLSHLDDKTTPMIQAGDLMASEARIETKHWLDRDGQHSRVFNDLHNNHNLWFIGALNKEKMDVIIRENIQDDADKARAIAIGFKP